MIKSFLSPLNEEQLYHLEEATKDCSLLNIAWMSGYLWGIAVSADDSRPYKKNTVSSETSSLAEAEEYTQHQQPITITILSASQTGNARRLAEKLRDKIRDAQLDVILVNAGDYKFKKISDEKILLIITSTYGEGDPPEEAMPLYNYLFSKRAPMLINTHFAVFGLGDSSYQHFAKIGKDFDIRLAELGASRICDRVDADIDYQKKADTWCETVVNLLIGKIEIERSVSPTTIHQNVSKKTDQYSVYTKQDPFSARIVLKQKITSRDAFKDVLHIEIDLLDSGLRYQPGDALGIWYENNTELIRELLEIIGLDANIGVNVYGKQLSLSGALQSYYELTKNTPSLVEKYAGLSKDKELLELVKDKDKLKRFALSTQIVDMMRIAPVTLCVENLFSLLRPMTPRLYSISSSQDEVGDEVHITVGVVRYEMNGRYRTGGASGFLAESISEDDEIKIFIENNDNFRLPTYPNTPMIMIGTGTGIAPFRAFMQQRESDGAKGKNWLLFGNKSFIDDFLYQVEWQHYVKTGLLTNIDLAWSLDQANKIYVQDQLKQRGDEIWDWIQQGSHIYVCGDANNMARDVEKSLSEIIVKNSCMAREESEEFLNMLRMDKRYQRDIYS